MTTITTQRFSNFLFLVYVLFLISFRKRLFILLSNFLFSRKVKKKIKQLKRKDKTKRKKKIIRIFL
jgi:hypothetical protein